MNELNVRALIQELEHVARAAGALVMGGYRKGGAITKKGVIDLVTEFDLASEAYITEELQRSFRHIPVVGEETQGKRAVEHVDDQLRFFVDPIDGTTNFAHGHPFFCISLGLCRGVKPIAGVIYAPALGVCWTGSVETGAQRNGEPCQVSQREPLIDALVATGFGYSVVGTREDNAEEFRQVQARSRAVRRCGAAALDLALVADGTYDAYWEFMLQPWDTAAGAALVLAAGGKVTDFRDQDVNVLDGAVVASNGHVHAELLRTVREARDDRPVPLR
ncbi:MAG TPA: inositol monophosphatase family protein [Polyangiales bacterium]|nr:inositol monophosphatase family protein [Polyangiales bacterium]